MTERLGAKFTLDITDLKSGITAANKLIAQNEAAFRADAAEMDDWGKTEEGLKKRIDTLNKNIDLQKGKVSALIEERKRIIEEGKKQGKTEEEIASSVDKLNKKITSEEKTLEKMRAEIEKNEKSLDGLNKEQEESAKASEKAAGGFTIAKGALASLAADGIKFALSGLKKLASALVNAGQNADNLNTLSKQTGFSTEELQKFEYAADLVDVSVSDITGAVRKLKKNVTVETGDVADAFAKIGVSVKDDAGEFRDINAIFYDVLEGLSKVGNETERDTLAMSIFGKGADELAGIIDDGGKALKDYGEEAENLGVIISGETLDAANEFNDSIDRIKSTGKGAFAVIGAEIAKEFVPEVEEMRNSIQSFVKSGDFKKLAKDVAEGLKNLFKIAKEVGKVALPLVLEALKFVAQNAKTLIPLLAKLAAGFVALKVIKSVTSLLTAFTSPLGLAVTLIGGAAVALGAFKSASDVTAVSIYELSSETKEAISSFKNLKNASKETMDAEDRQAERLNGLWKELQKITDSNGKIQEGYEKRADFIITELNNALGTEYSRTGDLIENYKTMQDEIEGLIEKKRALVYLGTLDDALADSISNTSTNKRAFEDASSGLDYAAREYKIAQEDFAEYEKAHPGVDDQKWADLKKRADNASEEYNKARKSYDDAVEAYYKNLLAPYVYDAAQTASMTGDYEGVKLYGQFFNGTLESLQNFLKARVEDLDGFIAFAEDENKKANYIAEREALNGFAENLFDFASYRSGQKTALGYTQNGHGFISGTGNTIRKGSVIGNIPVGSGENYGSIITQLNDMLARDAYQREIVINQYNNFSKEKSQYELYEAKQATVNAVKRVIDTAAAY